MSKIDEALGDVVERDASKTLEGMPKKRVV